MKSWKVVSLILVVAGQAHAHPHVWVDMAIELVVEGNLVRGFWVDWSFDEMMTAMVLADIPVGTDGRFTGPNAQRVFRDYFRNLENFNYFTYIWINRRPITVRGIDNFTAVVLNRRLVYRFFVPIDHPLRGDSTELVISMYDDTYWTDMGFRRNNPVRVSGLAPSRISWKLELNARRAYYGGMVQPEEAIITIKS